MHWGEFGGKWGYSQYSYTFSAYEGDLSVAATPRARWLYYYGLSGHYDYGLSGHISYCQNRSLRNLNLMRDSVNWVEVAHLCW